MLWPSEVSCSAYHLLWEDSLVFIVKKKFSHVHLSYHKVRFIQSYDRKEVLFVFELIALCILLCILTVLLKDIHIDNIQNVMFKEEGNWVTYCRGLYGILTGISLPEDIF